MHLKLTINGTAFTVATVRIVGKQETENLGR
jgi:hypothetical protein